MKFGLILATDLSNPNVNSLPPIGLGCIAASIKRHLPEVEVVMRESPDDLIDERPDVIGISATTEYYYLAIRWAARFKEELGAPVIAGGIHISLLPESLTPDFDVAVIGEGDITIVELLRSLIARRGIDFKELRDIPGLFFREDGQACLTRPRPLVQDLDSLPEIEWKGLPFYRESQGHIVSARGCPYKCAFCASEKFARQHRYYSAERIVREIEYFVVERGLRGITFFDDLLIANKGRLTSLIERLKERGLLGKCRFHCQVRANLVTEEICGLMNTLNIFNTGIGVESFSDRVLRYYNKTGITGEINQRAIDLLNQAGIMVNPSIIFGAPVETREDMLTTLRAVYRNCADRKLRSPAWTLLRPYPGTAIWDYAERRGLVSRDMDWRLFADWGTFDMYLCEQMPKDECQALIHEWQTKISLLRLDTPAASRASYGNFIFQDRRDLYEHAPSAQAAVLKRRQEGQPEEPGDLLLESVRRAPDSGALLLSGWHERETDGTQWIGKKAHALLPVKPDARLKLQAYIPPQVFAENYGGAINLTLRDEDVVLFSGLCAQGDFPGGLITLDIAIPDGREMLLLTIESDQSFIPAATGQGSLDGRELAVVIRELRTN
ncbi:MAG: radical SAM protein [Desulfobacteraceae bacterium]|nr:radical SAM protein [Desulfobacteraceae bacterium]